MTHNNDIDGYFSSDRVSARTDAVELSADGYRDHLYDHGDPMLAGSRGMDYEEFAQDRYRADFLRELLESWDALYREPFVGVTSDGLVREGLYPLDADPGAGSAADADSAVVDAAERLLALLTPGEREQLRYPLDAREWRAWSNPEFMIYRVGLRLEKLNHDKADAALTLLRESLSPEGFARVREAMALNGFLGELVELPAIMNEGSYWFSLFGEPSVGGAWGWQLFGHHVAVNFVTVRGRHVIAPVFLGGEPAVVDGPEEAAREHPPLFEARERLALQLAGSLTTAQRTAAVVYDSVLDPAMPAGRLHPADERHVAGAFRDNTVVPYEGIRADALSEHQRELLLAICEDTLLLLTEPQRRATMRAVVEHMDETWLSWYGATDGSQPFYLRIQSPVILTELDHHAGVWLSNRLPARFHIHSTLRLPNGNDYGKAYLAQLPA